jgi:hypothetical protein
MMYILNKYKVPVKCSECFDWAHFMGDINNRRTGYTRIGEYAISTVFIGIDHRLGIGPDDAPPILFESMVFGGGAMEFYTRRYCTWEEAEIGHADIVKNISMSINSPDGKLKFE